MRVARDRVPVALGAEGFRRLAAAREVVDRALASGLAVYGLNTGFGSLSRVRIDAGAVAELQRNLVRSHAAGAGPLLPQQTVRAMMVVLAASLARGHSGVRPVVVEQICRMLNQDLVPAVPCLGSVGASGDLAPLSHVALAMMGEGDCYLQDVRTRSGHALRATGLAPLALEAKEGLALINGTHFMAGAGTLALLDAERLFRASIRAGAMAIDGCLATDAFLDPRLHMARAQDGQIAVAEALRAQLHGSSILRSHLDDDPRVQDPYCLRCMPQVLGAALDQLRWVRTILTRELGAVTDNPLVFPEDGTIRSGGNFHGMPLAIAFDAARVALCHVAGISERRTFWALSGHDQVSALAPFLAPSPGLHSGLMIAQYTAAACCNELQTLCMPSSVANVTTSAGMEDYNSFGAAGARHFERSVSLARTVVAIELLCMGEAVERRRPLQSGPGVEAALGIIRTQVPKLEEDRPPSPDIAAIEQLIASGAFDGPESRRL